MQPVLGLEARFFYGAHFLSGDCLTMSWRSILQLALTQTPIGSALAHIPFLEKAHAWRTLRRTDNVVLFAGVFDSYAAAQPNIPAARAQGWNTDRSASRWIFHVDYMQPTAYAPFFWLSNLLREGATLIDYGGNIGLSYYGYVRRKELPPGVRWIIVELPHPVDVGKTVAQRHKATQLEFVGDLSRTPPCNVLFSAGALQYMEQSVPGLLEKLPAHPPHILLNKVPLTDAAAYWTLQNFGTALSPYRVFNAKDFIGYFENAGYTLRDRWEVPELSCNIPFHPR